eukprot:m.153136 g.153136  ORF g.153136 m.153136 type:complete len:62 (+) comp13307_c0_seq55:1084-1269(+)
MYPFYLPQTTTLNFPSCFLMDAGRGERLSPRACETIESDNELRSASAALAGKKEVQLSMIL